jgi:hypothetical protein
MKRVPQKRMASYLNMKPETFTRLKPLLEKNIDAQEKRKSKKTG